MEILIQIIKEIGGAIMAVSIVLGGLWILAKDSIVAYIAARLDRNNSVFEFELERSALAADEYVRNTSKSALEVWTALCDVDRHAEKLWMVAAENNLSAARDALNRLIRVTDRHEALIESEELVPLRNAVTQTQEYLSGKNVLIKLRSIGASDDRVISQIRQNRLVLQNLLDSISSSKNGLRVRTIPVLRQSDRHFS